MLGKKPWNTGKPWSEEARKKMSASHMGQPAWNKGKSPSKRTRNKLSAAFKGKPQPANQNEKHGGWKGDKVSYSGLHRWLQRHFKREQCECCGVRKEATYRLEFANKSGKYLRDIADYYVMCTRCHRQLDVMGQCTWHGTPLKDFALKKL